MLKLKRRNISEEDIISNLPDSLLSYILSFLETTEEALRTTILSKRWRFVWTCVNKLAFHSYSSDRIFVQFVYNVLKLHQGNIKEFSLFWYDANQSDVTRWIDIVIARGVQRLDLSRVTTHSNDFKLPLSLFTCKALTDFKIGSSFNILNNVFPWLKKLDASFVGFKTKAFKRFISQCSALEHLIVEYDPPQFHIVSSSMKRLELSFCKRCSFDEKILLGVPSLECLKIKCKLPSQLIIEDAPSSLIEAHIDFYDYWFDTRDVNIKQFRDSFVRFMQPLSNVKVLRLDSQCRRFLNSVGHGLFLHLTKLHIVSDFFEWRLLVNLMESSSNLEAITLRKMSTFKKHKLAWIAPKKVPISLSSALRKISIDVRGGRCGCGEDELPMLKYILGNAQILERVDVRCSTDLLEQIQKLPRACEICEISLLK